MRGEGVVPKRGSSFPQSNPKRPFPLLTEYNIMSENKINRNNWRVKRLGFIPKSKQTQPPIIEVNENVIPITKTRKVLD